jgi:hypothetical protein
MLLSPTHSHLEPEEPMNKFKNSEYIVPSGKKLYNLGMLEAQRITVWEAWPYRYTVEKTAIPHLWFCILPCWHISYIHVLGRVPVPTFLLK